MACMAKNRDLSYCKVVEVIAETTAPLTPMEELLKKIPSQRPIVSSPKVSSCFSRIKGMKTSELSREGYIKISVFFLFFLICTVILLLVSMSCT